MQATVRAIERDAGHELADPQEAVAVVSQRLRFTSNQQRDILSHLIRGGDVTAGGILHAVASVARALSDGDAANEMEGAGLIAAAL